MMIFIIPFIGAVIFELIGILWHGPIFGNAYMKAMGISTDPSSLDKKKMLKLMLVDGFLSYVFLFGFLMLMLQNIAYSSNPYLSGLFFALVFFVFFVLPQKGAAALWSGRGAKDSWKLFGIGAGYILIAMLATTPIMIFLLTKLV